MTTEEIDRTLTRTDKSAADFPKLIFKKFGEAVEQYRLIQPGDRIAVCISGGKDSMLMAKLFLLHKRYSRADYELRFLVMDPGYSPENLRRIQDNAQLLGIPVEVFRTDIFEAVNNTKRNPCSLCAKMRRGSLYNRAREMGCNKIALGHHFDDVIETILMSMVYGGQVETMLPKVRSRNFPGMELIRPLYLVRERDILDWCGVCGLEFLRCACRLTENSVEQERTSARFKVKQLIAQLARENPQVEMNIFNSVQNIKLNKIMSYKDGGEVTTFLDRYDR